MNRNEPEAFYLKAEAVYIQSITYANDNYKKALAEARAARDKACDEAKVAYKRAEYRSALWPAVAEARAARDKARWIQAWDAYQLACAGWREEREESYWADSRFMRDKAWDDAKYWSSWEENKGWAWNGYLAARDRAKAYDEDRVRFETEARAMRSRAIAEAGAVRSKAWDDAKFWADALAVPKAVFKKAIAVPKAIYKKAFAEAKDDYKKAFAEARIVYENAQKNKGK